MCVSDKNRECVCTVDNTVLSRYCTACVPVSLLYSSSAQGCDASSSCLHAFSSASAGISSQPAAVWDQRRSAIRIKKCISLCNFKKLSVRYDNIVYLEIYIFFK